MHSQITFYLPFGGALVLRFFSVDPPLNLKIGSVRFAAVLQDTDKIGLNYLLCRIDAEDLYGTWRVCRVRNGLFSQPTRPDPFGFDNAKQLHEIEVADQAMHIYSNEFSDQIQNVVLEIAKNTMLRANNSKKRAINQKFY